MSLDEVLTIYNTLNEEGKSDEEIYESLKRRDYRLLSRVFPVAFCLTKQDEFDWITILMCHPTRRSFIFNHISPETRGIIYAQSDKFKLLWLYWRQNTTWCYIELSATFVRLNLSIDYIDRNISKGWCFDILSGHPSLTLEFVQMHKYRDWCYGTLFDRFPGEYNTNLLITIGDDSYMINIPSFFQLTALYYHPLVPIGRKHYFRKGGCINLPCETIISNVSDGIDITYY